MWILSVTLLVFSLLVLYHGRSVWVWDAGVVVYCAVLWAYAGVSFPGFIAVVLALGILVFMLHAEFLHRKISDWAYPRVQNRLPKLSKTEQEALKAGDVWLEASIFQGNPDWEGMRAACAVLSEEEAHFLHHEVDILCNMLDEWDIYEKGDLPASVWQYIRDNGFFGLVIDKAYGGKGFSARAHSDIVMKLAARSGAAAVTVMVPNSLGPGELLQHYGTDAQKSYYLPRLAQGHEIPCFALTEPGAGSDATSISSEAIVVTRTVSGETLVGLSITLNKRWITLAPVATLIGLAVQLRDPDGLLREGCEGITCVLVPRDTPNLEIGPRHVPAGEGFMNGTVRGKDVFVPLTHIIGGPAMAGRGWQMLVECLSIGRSISLPALASASSSVSYIATSAFAVVRRQFNASIALFEGVQEKMAEIGGLNFLIQATRLLTVAAVAQGKKPSVASAITKYNNTELARIVVNHAMDVHGGRAVVLGPRNYLAHCYRSLPIAITVEGANIMTRNLLIFGQGSMACHPYIRREYEALIQEDKTAFHQLLWAHARYFLKNGTKALLTSLTGGYLIWPRRTALRREYQQFMRLSYAYAWLADCALLYLGGALKRRERLSARLADGLSYLYMAMGAIRLYEAEGQQEPDFALHAQWACAFCFYKVMDALEGFCDNFPSRVLGRVFRWVVLPYGKRFRRPDDRGDTQLVRCMTQYNAYRHLLKNWLYTDGVPRDAVACVEDACQLMLQGERLYRQHPELGKLSGDPLLAALAAKQQAGAITTEEEQLLIAIDRACWEAIQVDVFE